MKLIMFEDTVYGVTEKQLSAIWKIQAKDDELLIVKHLKRNLKKYKFIGFLHFSFRE